MQGVIDGAENNWPSYESLRHFEAAKFYSLTRHVISPEVVALSLKTWEKLSAEDQEHLMAAAKASVSVMRTSWDARVKRSEEIVLGSEHNVEVAQPDSSLFQAQVQSVWAQFLDNPTLKKLSEDIQAVQEAPA